MVEQNPFRILIVGGGIGGFAAAIALRGPNRNITILEQSRLNREIGATISLQPNASRILANSFNLSNHLRDANGMVDRGFRIYNTEGTLVREIPLLQKTEYEGDRIVYHRVDLHNSLKKAATSSYENGGPVELRTGERVIECDCENGIVTLENGEKVDADLIVGADGIHSVVREAVLEREISAIPTGLSAYRLMVSSQSLEEHAKSFCEKINPRDPFTSMIMAHDCRLIMGPARNGEIYSIVALVPDKKMNEDGDSGQSWVSEGSLDKMLESFKDFPQWATSIFKLSKEIGLWQLRDLDPLKRWTKGRIILIGDAAHAMLPTQGQGASQTVEDAEALGAFFEEIQQRPQKEEVEAVLRIIEDTRKDRATLVQKYSRDAAKPATVKGSNNIIMRPDEFMDYNCLYKGARRWRDRQRGKAT